MNSSRQHGFTLVELIIGASLMALVGLAVAMATAAFSNAYEASQDYNECLQSCRVNMIRLERMMRRSLLVIYADDHAMWIWREDTNGDGEMGLSETSLIAWEPSVKEIHEYRLGFPGNWSDDRRSVFDVSIPSWDLSSATDIYEYHFRRSRFRQTTVLAEGVTEFFLTVDPQAPYAEFVAISMTIERGRRSVAIRSAVTMRNNWTEFVEWSEDGWVVDRY
jgi:prepilin-type N-terminal cleavage/methylation domain-containing protein